MKNLLFSLILLCACSVSQSAKAQQLLEALEGEQSTKWKGTLTYQFLQSCGYDYGGGIDFQTPHSFYFCNIADPSQGPEGVGIGYRKHCNDVDTSVDVEEEINLKFKFWDFNMGGKEIILMKASNGYYLLLGPAFDGTVGSYCIK